MWSARYLNIDKSGLHPEVQARIEFFNDVDSTVYQKDFAVLPEDIDSDGFKQILQSQIDILNAKDAVTNDMIDSVIAKPIEITPS